MLTHIGVWVKKKKINIFYPDANLTSLIFVLVDFQVCGKKGRCKEFTEASIRQVQQITEAAIQAITDDIQKDKESGK